MNVIYIPPNRSTSNLGLYGMRAEMRMSVARSVLFSLRFRRFIGTSNRPSARLCDCLSRYWRCDIFEFPRVEGKCDGSLYFPTAESEQRTVMHELLSVTSLVKLTFIIAPNFPSVS